MNTEQLVDILVTMNSGWNRDGDHGVLKYLNQAHKILMSTENEATLILDSTTGKLPTLTTVEGTYEYSMPSTVRTVTGIYLISTSTSNRDYGRPLPVSNRNAKVVAGESYARIYCTRQTAKINSTTLAKVFFTKDPGDSEGLYYYEGYKSPTEITSENIQGDIPEPFEYTHLVPAASKLIEGIQNGTTAEIIEYIQNVLRPRMWSELNRGDSGSWDSEPVARDY